MININWYDPLSNSNRNNLFLAIKQSAEKYKSDILVVSNLIVKKVAIK